MNDGDRRARDLRKGETGKPTPAVKQHQPIRSRRKHATNQTGRLKQIAEIYDGVQKVTASVHLAGSLQNAEPFGSEPRTRRTAGRGRDNKPRRGSIRDRGRWRTGTGTGSRTDRPCRRERSATFMGTTAQTAESRNRDQEKAKQHRYLPWRASGRSPAYCRRTVLTSSYPIRTAATPVDLGGNSIHHLRIPRGATDNVPLSQFPGLVSAPPDGVVRPGQADRIMPDNSVRGDWKDNRVVGIRIDCADWTGLVFRATLRTGSRCPWRAMA